MPEIAFLVSSWLTSAGVMPARLGNSSARIMRPGDVSSTSMICSPSSSTVVKRPLTLACRLTTPASSAWRASATEPKSMPSPGSFSRMIDR